MRQADIRTLERRVFFERSDFSNDFYEIATNIDRWEWLTNRFDNFTVKGVGVGAPKIPKIVHQIWIGGRLPDSYRGWTTSWQRMNSTWEYRLWNEREILRLGLKNEKAFMKSATYGAKSDIARYEILERFGGVYADTDFECLRAFDGLIEQCNFFAGLIFASSPVVSNGLLGAIPGHPIMREAMNGLKDPVMSKDGMEVLNLCGPGYLTTLIFNKKELLEDADVIFPSSYFFPVPNFIPKSNQTPSLRQRSIRKWSFAIHYWEASWLRPPKWKKFLSRCKRFLIFLLQIRRPES